MSRRPHADPDQDDEKPAAGPPDDAEDFSPQLAVTDALDASTSDGADPSGA